MDGAHRRKASQRTPAKTNRSGVSGPVFGYPPFTVSFSLSAKIKEGIMTDPLREHLKQNFFECFGVLPPESFDTNQLLDMTNYHYLLDTETPEVAPIECPPEE